MKKRIVLNIGLFLFLLPGIEAQENSPYISKVYDFMPAPGQFVNDLPFYEEGDTKENMILKVEECITGDEKILVSLGAYGGYIVFGFDHPVVNVPGVNDFKIWGNAFYASENPNPNAPAEGGSCEPGIVMVSYDANGNGIPDDEWYELAGSEYNSPATIHNYSITYYKPDPEKEPVPDTDYPYLNDLTYIRWTDNQGETGYVAGNVFHEQSYWPEWYDGETLTFTGARLADNYIDESGDGSYYVQYAYGWGYADNHPNTDERADFNIEWAVDKDGNAVYLPEIHFIKVYTAVNQYCGWLGETSTEVMGAVDLHADATSSVRYGKEEQLSKIWFNTWTRQLYVHTEKQQDIFIHSVTGKMVSNWVLAPGENEISLSDLSSGVYLVKVGNTTAKIIITDLY
ncbi:MAG: T9SS type A sorting domain-containing protein [Candidatus Azobacteroides sp.]|nr:T9SS type A sorting domain-containing protein [Candidatus Azobacteroides sp.]